jgi:DNA-binding CsgD family transcriptional regulator
VAREANEVIVHPPNERGRAARAGGRQMTRTTVGDSAVVRCVVDLLADSGEPAALIGGAGAVHWANGAFWTLDGLGGAHDPYALVAALSDCDRRTLVRGLADLHDDGGPCRVSVTLGQIRATTVDIALTELPVPGAHLAAARVLGQGAPRDVLERARAMEAALVQIRQELHAFAAGEPDAAGHTFDDPPSVPLPAGLPARQRDVATLLIEGLSVQEIAEKLDLSLHTVRNHVKVVFRRTGVHSRAAFVARYHV